MYQALYRKWRPQTFDAVIGQEHITETLKNQVRTGHLSHAYIFIGTRGTGKTTCARILAKAVNCEHPVNGNPCCECDACRSIADGSAVDVVELDAASNNGVDNVRALREEAVFSPTTVRKRVYIIDEVHMLSTSAFNALLKILEEPPEHLMFILATTELQKVPATILSRCQRHSFKRLDAEKLADYLRYVAKQEQFQLSPDAANLIGRLSDGGVRDALSLLDQCSASEQVDVDVVYNTLGLAGNRRTAQLLDDIVRHDTEEAVNLFNSLWMDGKDPSSILTELCTLMRDTLIRQAAPKSSGALVSGTFELSVLDNFRKQLTPEELMAGMDTLQRTLAELKASSNPKMSSEICLISLCGSVKGESVKDLKARISRLEQQLKNGMVSAPRRAEAVPAMEEPEYEPEEPYDLPEPEEYYASMTEEPAYEPSPELPPERYEAPAAFEPRRPAAPAPEMKREPVPAAPAVPEREPVPAPEPIQTDASAPQQNETVANVWPAIRDAFSKVAPKDLLNWLEDGNSVNGTLEGSVLKVECIPGFSLMRFQKQTNIALMEKVAGEVLGRSIRVTVGEMAPKKKEIKSLDELKKFKEVTFM